MGNVRARVSSRLASISGDIALENKYSGGVRDVFRVRIVYPPDFLHALTDDGFVDDAPTPPAVYLMSHRRVWARRLDGHILSDWSLCLFVPGESNIEFRDHTAFERLLEVLKTFLMLERIYQRRVRRELETGVAATWPGPQRSHGIDGYIEAIADRGGLRDRDLCICGSGLTYARCHKEPVRAHLSAMTAAA